MVTKDRVLVQFVDGPYNLHRLPEFDSVLTLLGLKPADVYSADIKDPASPFLYARLTVDQARAVCKRAVLVRRIFFVWSSGPTLQSLAANTVSAEHELVAKYVRHGEDGAEAAPELRWKLTVDSFGPRRSTQERSDFKKAVLQFPVRPSGDPVPAGSSVFDEQFVLVEDRRIDDTSAPRQLGQSLNASAARTDKHLERHFFFGMVIATGQRGLLAQYDLKKRSFIGPTSTCAELSFVMANQALARPGTPINLCISAIRGFFR